MRGLLWLLVMLRCSVGGDSSGGGGSSGGSLLWRAFGFGSRLSLLHLGRGNLLLLLLQLLLLLLLLHP